MSRFINTLLVVGLVFPLFGIQSFVKIDSVSWQSKVNPVVLKTAESGETEFIIFLEEQANLSGAKHLLTKQEKGAYVYKLLTQIARQTQGPILEYLESRGLQKSVSYRSFWVTNMIWVRGDIYMVKELAKRPDVSHIYANPEVQLALPSPLPIPSSSELKSNFPSDVEWNIQRVKAPQVWASGYTGQGTVIGGQDTGYKWDHPALKGQYRGWDGFSTDHDYNWHDAIHSGSGYCGANWPEPCDVHGHGTHTMGTMVGDDGYGNKIGMAPGGKWIGCRNMTNSGVGTSITYSECYEWFIAPYPVGGDPFLDGDTSKAPDVINNSWSCPSYEQGCDDVNVLKTVVENLRAAGIVTVHSAGNSGNNCETVNTPAAIYEASFTVGATDTFDNIASFSSRGPVTVDGSNRLKPEVAAPGTSIRSSWPGPYYEYYWQSGTSMAAPHVAGLIALLLSAQPALTGNVDLIETLVEQNATPRTISQTCGGISGYDRPNNTYGWGLIDAWSTIEGANNIFKIQKDASNLLYDAGDIITYTINITSMFPLSPTHNIILTDVIPANVNFITATLPHIKTGDLIQWEFTSLNPGESESVNLVIQIPEPAPELVINQNYGVRSDEVLTILGLPIQIALAKYLYFPFTQKDNW